MNTLEQDVHYSRDVSKPMSQSFSQEIRTASVSPKLDEGTLKLHEIDPVNGLRLTQTSPTGGQLHSPSSNASSTASDASKMTEKQFKRIQRISALFPVQDVPEAPADVNIQQSPSFNYQLNLEHVEQQLAQRERELIKREGVLQAQQSEVRRQIQDLKWQLERRSGELVAQKQRVQVLVQSKVELQTQLESMKQQMSKQQQEFESTLQSFRKSPTRSASKYASKSPTPSNSTFPGTEGFQTPPPNPELESEVQQLRTEVESLRALKGQLAQREQQVMELRRALNIKEEELRQMRAGGVDTLSLQRRISELESALQMQTEESGSLRQQLANLRSSREHLGGKLDTLETQLHLEKIKSAQVKAKLKEVNETTSHGDCDSSGGAEGISGVIDEMEREIERLRDRLSYADSQVEDLTNELRHKDHEMADAHAQLVSLRKNVLTMNNQVVAYASENKELQEKLRSKAATAEIALSQAQRAAHELENLRQENASLQSLERTFLQRAEAMRIGYLACFALAAHKAFDLQQTLKVCQQSKRCIEQKVTELACDVYDVQRVLGIQPTSLSIQGVPCFPTVQYPKDDQYTQEKIQQLQEIGQELRKCQASGCAPVQNPNVQDRAMTLQERALEAVSEYRLGSRRRLVKLLRGRNPWIVWLRRVIVTSAVLLLKHRHQLTSRG